MAENVNTYISNDFLNKYMKTAPTAYILVYICVQKFIQEGKTVSNSEIADSLAMMESDVNKAIDYWKEKGEINSPSKLFSSNKYIPSAAPEYSKDEINYYINNNSDFRALLNSAENNLGKMLTNSEISTLYSLHDWLRLPLEVIEILLVYCSENGHRSMRYIEKVAITWVDDGVKDRASAMEHINNYNHVYMRIMKALGIGGKTPVPKQLEYIKRWTKQMSTDLILYGCEKAALVVTNGNPFPYADKIFENWKKSGIDTIQKARAADEKFAESREMKKNQNSTNINGTINTSSKINTVQKEKFNYEQRNWNFEELERLKREELKRNLEE